MKHNETLNSILTAALSCFARFGYKKTTLEDVARKAGMTKGNIYFHVKNKKDLYERTVSFALENWRQTVHQAVKQEVNVMDKFRIMAEQSFRYLQDNRDLRSLLAYDPGIFTLSPQEDRFREVNKRAMNIIKEILIEGTQKEIFFVNDIDHTSELIFSIYIMFLIRAYVKSEKTSVEKMFREGVDLLLRGLISHPDNINKT